VQHDHRVIVGVHHAGHRICGLGYFMYVAERGQACADIEELPDACLACEEPYRPAEKRPVIPRAYRRAWYHLEQFLGCLPHAS